jgi:Flp pilus assembly protein TadD
MYQDAIIKRPDWTKALEKLGDAQMAAGNDDEAIAVYLKIISLDGGNSGILYSLGVLCERKGALDDAVAAYQESLRHDPDNGDTHGVWPISIPFGVK